MNLDRRVCVQLSNARSGDLISGLANIGRCEEELGGKVGELDWGGVVNGETLDARQGDILGDFNTEALKTNNKNIGSAHALHGLMAQNIELSAVEGLIDFGVSNNGFVNLHASRQIELGKLRVLRGES